MNRDSANMRLTHMAAGAEGLSTADDADVSSSRTSGEDEALALLIAWCSDEPWRLGEIAWLPRGRPGEPRVFGRGGTTTDDPHPRLTFVRQRPWGPEAVAPLLLPKLSRVQLFVWSIGLDHVVLKNVGRCSLRVGGNPVEMAALSPGQCAELGKQVLLVCVRRSVALPAPQDAYPVGSFGTADGLGIVGESVAAWRLRQQLAIVGPRPGHVLLVGPSGCGKELSARALHALSARSQRALVARNAATIPDSLVDAELFGHARGYPSHGMPERLGLVGHADESTLFLDEIGEVSVSTQAHLLRLLDGGEYHRLGESIARKANLRIIAATNRDPSQLKCDLLARFPHRIEIPGLEARREDVPLLARHLLRQMMAFGSANEPAAEGSSVCDAGSRPLETCISLCRQLVERAYTGHFRELERLLLQSFVDAGGGDIQRLPAITEWPASQAARVEPNDDASPDLASLAPARIQAVLDAHNGRIESAARALGLKNRFALGRLISKYGLEVRRRRSVRAKARPAGH
jgi:two-component system nitrogen regulation response regulator GlnG/two-component system response regulator HydG